MRNRHLLLLGIGAVLATLVQPAPAAVPPARNFLAPQMRGAHEVPPVATLGQGTAVFNLSPDGTQLHFRVIVTRINNVVAAHIHTGAVGVNGPVVLLLFSGPAAGGAFNGLLAQGTVVRGVTPLPPTLGAALNDAQRFDVLIAVMRTGNTYVNVHTDDGVAPFNTGPGDIISGEIRGQVIPRP